eukprot:scaffold89572_cov17-Tisochrysis_lutea.AAC.1
MAHWHKALHKYSARAHEPFLAAHCALVLEPLSTRKERAYIPVPAKGRLAVRAVYSTRALQELHSTAWWRTLSNPWHLQRFEQHQTCDRLTMLPFLATFFDYNATEETYKEYDSMSAYELFRRCGVSRWAKVQLCWQMARLQLIQSIFGAELDR